MDDTRGGAWMVIQRHGIYLLVMYIFTAHRTRHTESDFASHDPLITQQRVP